ncbi:MAG: ATP phosphoribosyltransferase regulatory subunit, partial [Thermoleophilia bacterium]|nr:ATP phosphoribosyltransferase regulatory subunit [Thermoleophilia bacterium]
LDYYTRTVWEFQNDALGAAQSSICAGGRYDYLVEEIGGPATPGVGWAAGIERMGMSASLDPEPPRLDVFFACAPGADRAGMLAQMAELRRAGLRCDTDYAARSLKGQMTLAGRLRADTVVRVMPAEATIRRGGEDVATNVAVGEIASRVLSSVARAGLSRPDAREEAAGRAPRPARPEAGRRR